MKICIETPDKETWDAAQKACFKHGWDWEGEEWPEWDFDLQKDVWKSDPEFALNHDGWSEDVSHLCVIDGTLCTNYVGDGNPVDDEFVLKTIDDLILVN